jgi:hypothetical protein
MNKGTGAEADSLLQLSAVPVDKAGKMRVANFFPLFFQSAD